MINKCYKPLLGVDRRPEEADGVTSTYRRVQYGSLRH